MRRLLLLSALVGSLFSGFTLAADHPEIVQQGFSPDARYHLLLTSMLRDASGFPSAALQITDVRRNVIVYRREMDWGENEARPLEVLVDGWRRSQAAVLNRYHLSRPVAGQRLFTVEPLPMLDYPPLGTVTRATPAGLGDGAGIGGAAGPDRAGGPAVALVVVRRPKDLVPAPHEAIQVEGAARLGRIGRGGGGDQQQKGGREEGGSRHDEFLVQTVPRP